MYARGLGLGVLDTFENHEGFDGVMLGVPDANYHVEFTRSRAHALRPSPTAEDLLVFYIPSQAEWDGTCARMLAAGFRQVASVNPYWERHGRTFEDGDGYRVVLERGAWNPGQPSRAGPFGG
jgi:hypothetical protein